MLPFVRPLLEQERLVFIIEFLNLVKFQRPLSGKSSFAEQMDDILKVVLGSKPVYILHKQVFGYAD